MSQQNLRALTDEEIDFFLYGQPEYCDNFQDFQDFRDGLQESAPTTSTSKLLIIQ